MAEGRLDLLGDVPPGRHDAPAVIDGDAPGGPVVAFTHASLRASVAEAAAKWPAASRAVTLMAASWSPAFVVAYYAAHAAGQAVCLVDPARPWEGLADRLEAEVVVTDGDLFLPGLSCATRLPAAPVHDDLAVLLQTSGSTGGGKLVRLSAGALRANTADIVASLGITADDVAVGHLSPWYSFGLSVLHSHLSVGGAIVVTRRGPMDVGFWDMVRATGATMLPGVPFHYQTLRRFDFARLNVPALRTMTQAGGRLDPKLVEHFARLMEARGGRFVVMYGQTEASPRIACQAAAEVAARPQAVGRALPQVRLSIEGPDGAPLPAGEVGQVVVRGPNVMMGYANDRSDLARGDDMGGVLPTGDRGFLEPDGMLTLVGREARFAKLFGLRLDLEAIERAIEAPTVAVEKGDRLVLVTEGEGEVARRAAVGLTGLTPAVVVARPVEALPRLPNGKIDLRAAEALA